MTCARELGPRLDLSERVALTNARKTVTLLTRMMIIIMRNANLSAATNVAP